MDEWGIQQPRMAMNGIGPMHSYHPIRSRRSPYQINDNKHPYQQSTISVRTDSNPNMYTPVTYTPTHMEQMHQQRIITAKSTPGPIATYHPGHQQIMSTRARSMPYPSPSMYTHTSSGPICQCNQHMHHQMSHPNWYQYQPITYQQNYNSNLSDTTSQIMKNQYGKNSDESSISSTFYYPSTCTNSYIPAQQLPPQLLSISQQDYQTFSHQTSNPSTPHQGEFNEFGVPYQHGQPSSVNSLTDALCPNGDIIDRQMTPGPPSVGTPRVAQHQYSLPHTPSTPLARSRLSTEQNVDELTAFLQDPINTYLTDDLTSTLFDDIEALADTYLGGGGRNEQQQQQSNVDNTLDYDIILNYLCSDDLISTVCTN